MEHLSQTKKEKIAMESVPKAPNGTLPFFLPFKGPKLQLSVERRLFLSLGVLPVRLPLVQRNSFNLRTSPVMATLWNKVGFYFLINYGEFWPYISFNLWRHSETRDRFSFCNRPFDLRFINFAISKGVRTIYFQIVEVDKETELLF